MGSQVGEYSTQPKEGGLTKEGENLKESESFEDSEYDLRNDEMNIQKLGEYFNEEALEKQIEIEVQETNMKEKKEKNKDHDKGSNEEGEEDMLGSEDDFKSEKGSDDDETREPNIIFNPLEQYDPTFEL
ncbi:UNVERIFIED_CONTAM: hypothetical protein Sindi_1813300, partial [Sesamum indicum]